MWSYLDSRKRTLIEAEGKDVVWIIVSMVDLI